MVSVRCRQPALSQNTSVCKKIVLPQAESGFLNRLLKVLLQYKPWQLPYIDFRSAISAIFASLSLVSPLTLE